MKGTDKMINKVFKLREEENGYTPTLTTYILDNTGLAVSKRPAVLVCPGGGYSGCAPIEAEPVAMRFLAAGFNAFVLRYSVYPSRYPKALEEVSKSVEMIREHADEWGIEKDKIAVCGFSAGSHLACSLGVFWNQEPIKTENEANKPNAMILSYPVITSGEKAHRGSFNNLCGDDKELVEKMSLEKQVNKDTPKTFLWHTFSDAGVPVENSLLFANALREHDIPFEMHIYPEGRHGLSIVNKEVGLGDDEKVSRNAKGWIDLACSWLKEVFA